MGRGRARAKRVRGTLVAAGVVVLTAISPLGPGPTAAPVATLYEVTEEVRLLGRAARFRRDEDPVRRLATAALMGTVPSDTRLCPNPEPCVITALATSDVDLSTGRGYVHGTFKIVIQDDNTTDGPERVVIQGEITGDIDLSLAFFGPDGVSRSGDETVPLGSIDGRWTAVGERGTAFEEVRVRGTLSGVFRLPFTIPGLDDAFYLGEAGAVIPVQPRERSLSRPTVRLDLVFTEQP
jgi:hypothetical protein